MTTVNYTHRKSDFASEVVDEIFYNEKTKELTVVLNDTENVYKYSGVLVHVWNAFEQAVSKGYFYNKLVKPTYGPASNLGWADTVSFEDANEAQVYSIHAGNSVGTPKGLTTNEDTKVSTNVTAFPLKAESTATYATVHTSAPEVKFDDAISTDVVFNLGGSDATTTFNDVVTVSGAVAEITRIAEMLGLGKALTIKSVTVNFE
jgi:hypothetical protein